MAKAHEDSFQGDRYVHYLDCSGGLMNVYMSKLIQF